MIGGRRAGNIAGPDTAQQIWANIDPLHPGARVLTWLHWHAWAYSKIMVDGIEVGRTSGTELSNCPPTARAEIQVFEYIAETLEEPLRIFCTWVLDGAALTWAEVSGIPANYEVYLSATTGVFTDPPVVTIPAGQATYEHIIRPLPELARYFLVIALDAAGNPTDSNETNLTVAIPPAPPTDLTLTHNNETGATTIAYTGSPSADLLTHNIYRAVDGPVELTAAPFAQTVDESYIDDNSAVTARVLYLVRAKDTTPIEEAGLEAMAFIDLQAGVQVQRPNTPVIREVTNIAEGQVRVTVEYDRAGEIGVAATIRIYAGIGSVSWASPVGTGTLATGLTRQVLDIDTSGLSEATYLVAARARTSGGVEDTNTNTVEIATDATGPAAPAVSVEAT